MVKILQDFCSWLLAGIALMALGGCQSAPSKPEAQRAAEAAALAQFTQQAQVAMFPGMLMANKRGLVGAMDMVVKLDRNSQPIECRTRPTMRSVAGVFPAEQRLSSRQDLDKLITGQCWKTIFPKVPAHLFGDDDDVEIIAPLFFLPIPPAAADSQRQRLLYQAQVDYLWQQIMLNQPVDSIGVARLRIEADAQGKVQACLVSLDPTRTRPDAFKLDSALQERLTAQCRTLDLKRMPGFVVDDKGRAQAYVWLEYAPWKVGRD